MLPGDKTSTDDEERLLLTELEVYFVETIKESPAFRRAFKRWRQTYQAMEQFETVDEVKRFFRNPRFTYEEKRGVIEPLSERKKAGDEYAALVLIWLFLPSMHSTRKEVDRTSEVDPQVMDEEMLSGFLEALQDIGLPEVDTPSGHLANSILRQGTRAKREVQKQKRLVAEVTGGKLKPEAEELPEEALRVPEREEPGVLVPETETGSDEFQVLRTAVAEGVIREEDAYLIATTKLGDLSIKEVAAQMGETEDTLYKRRRRAGLRLKRWIQEQRSQDPEEI